MSPNSLASVPCSTGANTDRTDCHNEDDTEDGYDALLVAGPVAPLGDEMIDGLASLDSGKGCHSGLEKERISPGKSEVLYAQCTSPKCALSNSH